MTKLSLFLNRMRTQAEHSFDTILYLEYLHKKGNLCHSTVATLGKLVIWGSSNGRKRKQAPPPPLWNGCDETRCVIHTNWTFTAVQL